jgi:hypothetical protein
MEFYSATKKNEILSFASKWMELENILPLGLHASSILVLFTVMHSGAGLLYPMLGHSKFLFIVTFCALFSSSFYFLLSGKSS